MKIRKEFQLYFILTVILLVFASFYDYEVSAFLYNRTSLILKSIHIVAQAPTYLLLTFLSVGIFNTRNRDGSLASMFSVIGGVTGALVFGFMACYIVLYNMGLYSITFTMAVDLGIYVSCYILTKIICDRHAGELRRISKLGFVSFVMILLIFFILTTVFERIGYRRLDDMVNVFANWYALDIRLDLTGFMNRSFPSMTVGYASLTIILNYFTRLFRVLKERRAILTIAVFSWIFIVIISQLVLGYAYLSDVMMALIIGNLVIGINYLIIYRKKDKQVE